MSKEMIASRLNMTESSFWMRVLYRNTNNLLRS